METPLERMEQVMRMRGWSQRQWAEAAQLKEPTNVNKIMKRIRETGEISGDMQTFVKLADAAKVSLDWLLLGRGLPVPPGFSVTTDAKYPTRAAIVFVGELLGFPKEAIDHVLATDAGSNDPGSDFWLQILLGERNKISVRQPPQSGQKP